MTQSETLESKSIEIISRCNFSEETTKLTLKNIINDLTPDPNEYYEWSFDRKNKGFTLLMALITHTEKYPLLHEYIKMYLDANPMEVEKRSEYHWSPLGVAIVNLNAGTTIETIQILIEYGANVNAVDELGITPLMLAAKYSGHESSPEVVKMLLDYGATATINNQDNQANTALLTVANHRDTSSIESIEILIEYGADVNIRNSDGKTIFDMCDIFRPLIDGYKAKKKVAVLEKEFVEFKNEQLITITCVEKIHIIEMENSRLRSTEQFLINEKLPEYLGMIKELQTKNAQLQVQNERLQTEYTKMKHSCNMYRNALSRG